MGNLENVTTEVCGWQVTCRYTDGVFALTRPKGGGRWDINVDRVARRSESVDPRDVLDALREFVSVYPKELEKHLMMFWDDRRRYWALRHDRSDRERERVLDAAAKCVVLGNPAATLAALVLRISESEEWRDALLVLLEEDAEG